MALRCGLCISGQTINDCVKKLNDVECISNQIVIMLGAVDIYNVGNFLQYKFCNNKMTKKSAVK